MAAEKLTYENKSYGSMWRHSEANEIKAVVNSHADDIDELGTGLAAAQSQMTQQGLQMSQQAAQITELGNSLTQLNTSHGNRLTALESKLEAQYPEAEIALVYPWCLYIWEEPVESLQLTLCDDLSNYNLEYRLRFTVGTGLSEPFTISFKETDNTPYTPMWLGGEEPEWEEGYTYEVSIQGGLAISAGWEPEES